MYALSGQRIEEHGKSRHEGLAFTGGHLGDLSLVQHDAADQLHIVVDHVPRDHVAARHPAVAPHGVVAVNVHEIVAGAQVAVEIGGPHTDLFVLLETARRGLDDSKRLGKHLVQYFLDLLVNGLVQFVHLRREFLLEGNLHLGVGQLLMDLRHLLFLGGRIGTHFFPDPGAFGTQVVVAQLVDAVIRRQHELQGRIQLLDIAFRLGAK